MRTSRAVLGFALFVLACGDDGGGDGATTGGPTTGGTGGSGAANGGGGTGGSGAANGGGGSGGESVGGGGSGGAPRLICPGGPYADDPMPADPTASLVQDGFDFLEGPLWVAEDGALYFSDMHFNVPNAPPLNGPSATMNRLTLSTGVIEPFIEDASTNGLGLALDGRILGCTHDERSLSFFDRVTLERTTFVDDHMGSQFNSPNDVVVRSDGNVYFSDPDWQLSGTSELPMAAYRVSPRGTTSVVELLNKPNGVTLSADESTLFVGALDGMIRAYPLAADGTPGAASDFAFVDGPDGMTRDCAGNLYISGNDGVVVLSPEGDTLGTIDGTGNATNVAFGGADRRVLFITAGDGLYSIEMPIPGHPY